MVSIKIEMIQFIFESLRVFSKKNKKWLRAYLTKDAKFESDFFFSFYSNFIYQFIP